MSAKQKAGRGIDIEEAARILSVTRYRIRELVESGAIKGQRCKAADGAYGWIIDLDSVIVWEARIRGAAAAPSAIARRAQIAGVGADA